MQPSKIRIPEWCWSRSQKYNKSALWHGSRLALFFSIARCAGVASRKTGLANSSKHIGERLFAVTSSGLFTLLLGQTCVLVASYRRKTRIYLHCSLSLRVVCNKVCETNYIEFAISIFTEGLFWANWQTSVAVGQAQAKPKLFKSCQVKLYQATKRHSRGLNPTFAEITMCTIPVVFWTMGVSLQFLKANQAIEHIHSFSNVFILIWFATSVAKRPAFYQILGQKHEIALDAKRRCTTSLSLSLSLLFCKVGKCKKGKMTETWTMHGMTPL